MLADMLIKPFSRIEFEKCEVKSCLVAKESFNGQKSKNGV